MKVTTVFSFLIFLTITASCQDNKNLIRPGAYQLDDYLPLLKDKSVAIVVNPTSEINGVHLADTLIALGIDIKVAFAPEHGFRGEADAGQKIEDGVDGKTGIPIISLYGSHKKPTIDDLAGVDIVLFDIQDVGARFYTFISTMHYVMEACAENNKPFLVLDRPNPNGQYVDGPVLEPEFQSFVGMHEIPVVHGLTVGELAKMINGEGWLNNKLTADLTVVPVKNYDHSRPYPLPVKPSPNLPTDQSIKLYPSLCFFEPTVVSIGRGTYFPFQVYGYTNDKLGPFSFTPVSIPGMSTYPKHENEQCLGEDLRDVRVADMLDLSYLLKAYNRLSMDSAFFTSPSFFDKLAGTDRLRLDILSGKTEQQIRASWQEELDQYKKLRKGYLLYPDFE